MSYFIPLGLESYAYIYGFEKLTNFSHKRRIWMYR